MATESIHQELTEIIPSLYPNRYSNTSDFPTLFPWIIYWSPLLHTVR
jgi:hypothetical protein